MNHDILVASSVASTSTNSKRGILNPPITDEERERRKKRPRQVTSCEYPRALARMILIKLQGTTCVKRKTKCDRGFPCGACVKRGEPSSCLYDGEVEM